MASGLLVLALGRATRLIRFLPHAPKLYCGTIRLGVTSDTDDATGELSPIHPAPLPDAAAVLEAARELEGRSMQIPPAVSARKVGGRRLYSMARQGVRVEAPASEIDVSRLALAPTDSTDLFQFTAEVSAGTYIRGLARDLGLRLGCGALLASLRRTGIGPLSVETAVAPPEREPSAPERLRSALVPLERAPLTPPTVRLPDPASARRFGLGGAVAAPETEQAASGTVRVLGPEGDLLGIADHGGGRLQPKVVLPPLRDPE